MSMEFATFPFLTAILTSCIAGLLIILFIPDERQVLIKQVSLVFSGIAMVLSVYLFFAYDKGKGGLQFVEKVLWSTRWAFTTSMPSTASACPCWP